MKEGLAGECHGGPPAPRLLLPGEFPGHNIIGGGREEPRGLPKLRTGSLESGETDSCNVQGGTPGRRELQGTATPRSAEPSAGRRPPPVCEARERGSSENGEKTDKHLKLLYFQNLFKMFLSKKFRAKENNNGMVWGFIT